jgi:REP element-mobilizing transposase RayT
MVLLRHFDPNLFHRRSIRLKGYDYSQPGIYFFTTRTHFNEPLFGVFADGHILLNPFGEIVKTTWFDLPKHNHNITLDAFVVMPDHFHGIIIINKNENNVGQKVHDDDPDIYMGGGVDIADDVGAGSEPAPTSCANGSPNPIMPVVRVPITKQQPLSEIIRQFKTFSALHINELRKTPGVSVWQRDYYESIIRRQANLDKVRKYILTNPNRMKTLNDH